MLAIAPARVAAQTTASEQGHVEVEIASPISITHDSLAAMRFGSFVVGAAGTVRIGAGGNVTTSPGIDAAGGFTSLDTFTIRGEPGRLFSVLQTQERPVLRSANDLMPLAVEYVDGVTGYRLSSQGAATLRVGGTLGVRADQRPGAYTGQYLVRVAYE